MDLTIAQHLASTRENRNSRYVSLFRKSVITSSPSITHPPSTVFPCQLVLSSLQIKKGRFKTFKQLTKEWDATQKTARKKSLKKIKEGGATTAGSNHLHETIAFQANKGQTQLDTFVATDTFGRPLSRPMSKTVKERMIRDMGTASGYLVGTNAYFNNTALRKGGINDSTAIKGDTTTDMTTFLNLQARNTPQVRFGSYLMRHDYCEMLPRNLANSRMSEGHAKLLLDRFMGMKCSLYSKEGRFVEGREPKLQEIAVNFEQTCVFIKDNTPKAPARVQCYVVGCDESFDFEGDLVAHMNEHRAAARKNKDKNCRVVCRSCGEELAIDTYMSNHVSPTWSSCDTPSRTDPMMDKYFDHRYETTGIDPTRIPPGVEVLKCDNAGCGYWSISTSDGLKAINDHKTKCCPKLIKTNKEKAKKRAEKAEKRKSPTGQSEKPPAKKKAAKRKSPTGQSEKPPATKKRKSNTDQSEKPPAKKKAAKRKSNTGQSEKQSKSTTGQSENSGKNPPVATATISSTTDSSSVTNLTAI